MGDTIYLPDTGYLSEAPRKQFGDVAINVAWNDALRAYAQEHLTGRRSVYIEAGGVRYAVPVQAGDKGIKHLHDKAWALLRQKYDVDAIYKAGVFRSELLRQALHLYIQAHNITPELDNVNYLGYNVVTVGKAQKSDNALLKAWLGDDDPH